MFNFVMKQMIKRQLKNVPKDQQDKIMNAIEKDPQFFTKIAKEVEEKTKSGVDQQTAAMSVMMKYKDEIGKLMQG